MKKHTMKDKNAFATIAIIGKTGTGKSTICNAFLLGNTMENGKADLFAASASVNSCTFECKEHIGTLMDDG